MELFNIICGVCSILGLLVSIFTASKVIKITQIFHYGDKEDRSKVINKSERNTYNSSYAGRDNISGTGNNKQE